MRARPEGPLCGTPVVDFGVFRACVEFAKVPDDHGAKQADRQAGTRRRIAMLIQELPGFAEGRDQAEETEKVGDSAKSDGRAMKAQS